MEGLRQQGQYYPVILLTELNVLKGSSSTTHQCQGSNSFNREPECCADGENIHGIISDSFHLKLALLSGNILVTLSMQTSTHEQTIQGNIQISNTVAL